MELKELIEKLQGLISSGVASPSTEVMIYDPSEGINIEIDGVDLHPNGDLIEIKIVEN